MSDDYKVDSSRIGRDGEGHDFDEERSWRRHRRKKETKKDRKSPSSRHSRKRRTSDSGSSGSGVDSDDVARQHKKHQKRHTGNDGDDGSSASRGRRRSRDNKKSRRRKRKSSSRHHDSSSSRGESSSSMSYSESDSTDHRRRKRHKRRKHKKKTKKRRESRRNGSSQDREPSKSPLELNDNNNHSVRVDKTHVEQSATDAVQIAGKDTAETAPRSAAMAPMSREQYEALQSQIREVYDEESGRYRLVRGTGEIIERIVSRDDHQSINQRATRGDGASFSKQIMNRAFTNNNSRFHRK